MLAALLISIIAAHPGLAADPQPYKVKFVKTGQSALDAALSGSSSLIGLQKTTPVGPFALAGRIRADTPRLQHRARKLRLL